MINSWCIYGHKISAIFLATLLVLTISQFSIAAKAQTNFEVAQAVWGSVSSPQEVWPGAEFANLAVIIKNNLGSSAKSLSVELRLPAGITALDGTQSAFSFRATALSSGESDTFNFPLKISKDVAPRLLPFDVTIKYSTGSSSGGILIVEEAIANFKVKISDPPRFRFHSSGWGSIPNDIAAAPGDESVNLFVQFQNPTRFSLTPIRQVLRVKFPFANTTGGSEVVSILTPSSVSAGSIFSSKFPVNVNSSARLGRYELEVETEFLDTWSSMQSQADKISVQLLGRPEVEVKPDRTSLLPGRSNTVEFILKNSGSGGLTNFEANFTTPTGVVIVGADNAMRISKLQGGMSESKKFELQVSEDLASTNVKITVAASYKDSYGSKRSISRSLGMEVLAIQKATLEVTAEDFNVTPGATNRVNLLIRNLADVAIRDFRADLSTSTTATIVGSGSSFSIPVLQPGAVSKFPVTVYVLSTAEGGIVQISASLSYLDAGGTTRTATRTLGLNVRPSSAEILELKASSPTLLPGVVNDIELSVRNIGNSSLSDLKMIFSPPSTITILGKDSSLFFKELGIGLTSKAPLQLFVASSAAGSVLQIPISVTFRDASGASQTSSKILGFTTVLEQAGVIRISFDPSSVVADATNELRFNLRNGGNGTLRDVRVSVSAPSPISIISEQKRIGDLRGGANASTTVRLSIPAGSATAGGSIKLQLLLTYLDIQGAANSESQTVWVAVREWSSPWLVQATPNILRAGRMNKPVITMQNTLKTEIRSIEALLAVVRGTVTTTTATSQTDLATISQGTERWLFDSAPAGGRVTLSPEVFPSLSAVDSLQNLLMTLTYIDSNGNWHKETKNIGFSVRGSITMSFEPGQTVPNPVLIGRNFTVTGTILNKGNAGALYSRIQLKPTNTFVPSDGGVYIGDIEANTPIPFSLPGGVPPGTRAGSYPATVVLSYEDSYGAKYSDELNVNVNVASALQQRPFGQVDGARTGEQLSVLRQYFLLSLGAIIAAGLFGIFRIRKSRKIIVEPAS